MHRSTKCRQDALIDKSSEPTRQNNKYNFKSKEHLQQSAPESETNEKIQFFNQISLKTFSVSSQSVRNDLGSTFPEPNRYTRSTANHTTYINYRLGNFIESTKIPITSEAGQYLHHILPKGEKDYVTYTKDEMLKSIAKYEHYCTANPLPAKIKG